MDTMSVRPSKTTVIYGQDTSTAEKDAKNDVLTDTEKNLGRLNKSLSGEKKNNGKNDYINHSGSPFRAWSMELESNL